MRLTILVSFLLSAFAANGAETSVKDQLKEIKKQYDSCMKSAVSNVEINGCSGQMHESSDKLLNELYQKITNKLRADSKDKDEYIAKAALEILRRIIDSERKWIDYRMAECTMTSAQMLGGTGENLIYYSCFADMTYKRVETLDAVFGEYLK